MEDEVRFRFEELIKQNRAVLFMKGSASFPVCGMSSTVRFIMKKCEPECSTVDLLRDPSLYAYLREKHVPISAPYLYVNGKFVGGYDKVIELFHSGKLQSFLR